MSKGGRLLRLFPRFFKSDSKTKTSNASGDVKGRSCSVVFLDDSEKLFPYKNGWKGQVLLDEVCGLINLSEKFYFGLRYLDDTGQAQWLDGSKSLSSQLKRCSGSHPKLYFGVKFYIADPCKLREEITQYLFFLQVKKDILQGRLPIPFEEAAELCAYALQSELGDFDPRIHTLGYVSEFSFVPNQTEELEARIASMHRRCQGATPVMTEHKFLDKVKWLEMYGVDLHPVQDTSNIDYFLGLTPTGIVVYKHKTKIATHFWPRVTKARRKGKVFTIKVKDKNNDEHFYAFELSTKSACKHLWKCCVEHRTFFSERSERLAAYGGRSKNEPNVHRAPSKRRARRVSSDSRLNTEQLYKDQYVDYSKGVVTMIGQPEPVKTPRHRSLPELHGRQSPRSVKSAPWESRFDHGLYTSGHDTPTSVRQTSFVSVGSDSESGISQRKRYFPSRKSSDNESDVSISRRRRREMDSDSGSEVSFPNSSQNRRNYFGHRNIKTSDSNIAHSNHDKGNNSHGSIPSIHSAPAGEIRQRRRRRRSKSLENSKKPPEELKQHIEFDLVDTEGMTEEQLRNIAYTKVETKANLFRIKYSPKIRQKVWASRRKSSESVHRENEVNLSRQNSNNTDPIQRYTQNNRYSGGLKGGQLVDNNDGEHQREMLSRDPVNEQNKIYSSPASRGYVNKNSLNNKGNPYDSSSNSRMRNDRISQNMSDHEQSSVNEHQRYQNIYEQSIKIKSEQVQQDPYEGIYKQKQPNLSSNNFDQGNRKYNSERENHLFSESDRHEDRHGSYSNSPKQDSYNSRHNYGLSVNQVQVSSGHFNDDYYPSVEDQKLQRPYFQSTPVRNNEIPVTGSQRGHSAQSRYSEISSVGQQRGTSKAYGNSETTVPIHQRGNSSPQRATTRMNIDQWSTPLRPGSYNCDDQELPKISQSVQLGFSNSSQSQQNMIRHTNNSYPQAAKSIAYNMTFNPSESTERSPHNSSITSSNNQDSPRVKNECVKPQNHIKYRSDLVTQL